MTRRLSCGMCTSATVTLMCHMASVLSAVWDAGLWCGGGNRTLYGFGNRLSGTLPDVLSTWTALTYVMCISRDGCRVLRLCVAARRLVVNSVCKHRVLFLSSSTCDHPPNQVAATSSQCADWPSARVSQHLQSAVVRIVCLVGWCTRVQRCRDDGPARAPLMCNAWFVGVTCVPTTCGGPTTC